MPLLKRFVTKETECVVHFHRIIRVRDFFAKGVRHPSQTRRVSFAVRFPQAFLLAKTTEKMMLSRKVKRKGDLLDVPPDLLLGSQEIESYLNALNAELLTQLQKCSHPSGKTEKPGKDHSSN